MSINRRRFLQAASAFSATALFNKAAFAAEPTPLPIPPIDQGVVRDGVRHFALATQYGNSEFFKGYSTATMGYNGAYLGPTLRVRRGEELAIRVANQLDIPTTTHWHGMVLPAKMDGGPHQMIAPGSDWHSTYPVNQRGSTLFYHAHTHGATGEQVYRGLAGTLLVDDDRYDALNLPDEYGVDDIPLILQDRDFDERGQFAYLRMMPDRMIGKHGKHFLINGAIAPVFHARKTLIRLRLINASNARFYRLAFSDNRAFSLIGSDGGLLPAPVTLKSLELAPAERYEILVDLSDREPVILKTLAGAGNTTHGPMRMLGMGEEASLLLIDPRSASESKREIPAQLVAEPDWFQTARAKTERTVALQMQMMSGMGGHNEAMLINGQAFDMRRIDFRLKPNQFELWKVQNHSSLEHPFHIHNTQFRVLSRNGQPVPAQERGLKDTVIVRQREEVRILMPTGPYTDERIPYMFHCHILEHEDAGMMGQFLVTA